ncbi:hypothetical protein R3P38DRAFT_3277584 [Favolaschia claudopus]|uniref:Uncharacterized protein n=1 Tax=Favolaschia claudopus TaxID=2862362 RepID=A0AAW0AMT9_9AGAR
MRLSLTGAFLCAAVTFNTGAALALVPQIRADRSLVVASTNAQRFALGLPPLPPRRLTASPRLVAPRAGSSPLPPVTITCLIALRRQSDNALFGYLNKAQAARYPLSLRSRDLPVGAAVGTFQIPGGAPSASGLLVNLENPGLIIGGATPGHVTPDYMAPTSNYFANLAAIDPTLVLPPGYAYQQSILWSFDVASRALSPSWLNPDGTVVPLYIDVPTGAFIRFTAKTTPIMSTDTRVRFECA